MHMPRLASSFRPIALGGLLVAVLLATMAPAVRAQSATPGGSPAASGWPMFGGNAARTGSVPGPAIAGAPTLRWRFQAAGGLSSNPVVANGVVYVGCDCPRFYAIDAATGAERWHVDGPSSFAANPAVVNGLVYIANSDGDLFALDAATGAQRWQFHGARDAAGPAVLDGVVYSGGADSNLYALDAATGAKRWASPLGASASRSPTIGNGMVYIGDSDGSLHAVEAATGKEVWKRAIPDGGLGTPVFGDGLLYQGTGGSDHNHLYALDPATGQTVWTFASDSGATMRGPAIGDGVIFAASDDHAIYALDSATGKLRWRFETEDETHRSPALVGGALYVASYDRHLYAVDAATGAELWRFPIDGPTDFGPSVADGVAYVPTAFGGLYAIGGSDTPATPEPPVLSTTISAPAAPVATASPVAIAGTPFAFEWRTTGGPEPLAVTNVLAVAPNGDLWAIDGDHNRFQIFTPDGRFRAFWGEAGNGDGQFHFQVPGFETNGGIAFRPDGGYYVADTGNHRVQQFDADRRFVRAWGGFGPGNGQFVDPVGVSVDPAGNVAVIDDRRDDIQVFSPDGAYRRTIGGHGHGDGQISTAGWGAFAPDGTFWIVDQGDNRVEAFAPDGSFLRAFGENELSHPQALAVDDANHVYVTDGDNHRVVVYDTNGNRLTSFTGADAGGTRFVNPVGIALDGQGHLYVHDFDDDAGYEAVQQFQLRPPLGRGPAATPTT